MCKDARATICVVFDVGLRKQNTQLDHVNSRTCVKFKSIIWRVPQAVWAASVSQPLVHFFLKKGKKLITKTKIYLDTER